MFVNALAGIMDASLILAKYQVAFDPTLNDESYTLYALDMPIWLFERLFRPSLLKAQLPSIG